MNVNKSDLKKYFHFFSIILFAVIFLNGCTVIELAQSKKKVKEMFRMNKKLQQEGYYTAEFEFKMLGLSYYLNKGEYSKASTMLTKLHHQLETREGLIKLPSFKNKSEEMDFYLSLQNADTGAFMDPSYPFCTYTGPTGNVLEHLEQLSSETGRPLKLKYRLKYLDEINTPEKLTAYFNSVATVGWFGSKFPQTTFHNTRDILSLFYEDSVVMKYNLYPVTPEFKDAMIEWFYNWQDSKTGLWGPKNKKGKLMKKDTSNTASILKVFVGPDGKNNFDKFPLRYKDELCNSFLDDAMSAVPGDDDPDDWHEWNIKIPKTIKSLTRYLWGGLSENSKLRTKKLIQFYIATTFDKFYVYEEGSFTNMPNGKHAVLDASSTYSILTNIGALSSEKQIYFWGNRDKTILKSLEYKISEMDGKAMKPILNQKNVNAYRIFQNNRNPVEMSKNVAAVFYPGEKTVLDIMDLMTQMEHWLQTTNQSMGNWVSKDTVLKEIKEYKVEKVPVYENGIPLEKLNQLLNTFGEVTIIGFDTLQIPVYKATFFKKQQ